MVRAELEVALRGVVDDPPARARHRYVHPNGETVDDLAASAEDREVDVRALAVLLNIC